MMLAEGISQYPQGTTFGHRHLNPLLHNAANWLASCKNFAAIAARFLKCV